MALHPSISNLPGNFPAPGTRAQVFLLPGELSVAEDPTQVTTILGSCVAICIWDRHLHIGGVNHYLLPAASDESNASLRFGDVSTRELLKGLLQLGCSREYMQAKLFGGSALFRQDSCYASSLGAQNVAAAGLMLKNADIPILSQDTGGPHGRKIIFNTDDGSAWSRKV